MTLKNNAMQPGPLGRPKWRSWGAGSGKRKRRKREEES
jgi:hypothetical protein